MHERRDWLSFESGGDTYLFDLTFLMSSWTCIYGNGCKGILDEDATNLEQGCCTHGAHFADKPDRVRVKEYIKRLDDSQWQNREAAQELGGAVYKNDEGDWVTRQHEGACIMLNGPNFERGAGCALHVGALDHDERPLDWKPEVCWQLPLRLTYNSDEVDHTTYTLKEWTRRDWGDGGVEFHWWCTEGPEAFQAPDANHVGAGQRVVDTMREEIIEMVGEPIYKELLDTIDSHESEGTMVAGPVRKQSTNK